MNIKIDLKSLSINKSSLEEGPFEKYNIDVSLNELETSNMESKLQFSISFLSEPKNIKLFFDGLATITGNESERKEFLEKIEDDIPLVLHSIYDELFPIIFMMAKTAKIPSPSIRLSKSHTISSTPNTQSSELFETSIKSDDNDVEAKDTSESENNVTDNSDVSQQEDTDKDLHDMSIEELNQLYEKLDKEYGENPSQEIQNRLEETVKILQEKSASEQT